MEGKRAQGLKQLGAMRDAVKLPSLQGLCSDLGW